MQINNAAELKTAIAILEEQKQIQKTDINHQFKSAISSLNPLSNITKAINRVDVPEVISSLLAAAVGTGAGFLSKKILVGKADGFFKKAMGKLVEFVVAGLVTKKTDFSE